jgi:hypothetical protein
MSPEAKDIEWELHGKSAEQKNTVVMIEEVTGGLKTLFLTST